MPVFNGEAYVEAAIRAVQAQTLDDFELVVSDNASTDRSIEICRDLAANDPRIRVVQNESNVGAAKNFNRVFSLSAAPYFRWANADDLSAPTLHEDCICALRERPDAVLAYGRTTLIDADGAASGNYDDRLNLQQESPHERLVMLFNNLGLVNVIYGLMRSAAVRSTNLMGTGMIPTGDVRFLVELCLRGKFVALSTPLFFRRVHSGASSWRRDDVNSQQFFWNGDSSEFKRPQWSTHMADLRAIERSPLNIMQKAACFGQIARRMYWAHRDLFLEIGAP